MYQVFYILTVADHRSWMMRPIEYNPRLPTRTLLCAHEQQSWKHLQWEKKPHQLVAQLNSVTLPYHCEKQCTNPIIQVQIQSICPVGHTLTATAHHRLNAPFSLCVKRSALMCCDSDWKTMGVAPCTKVEAKPKQVVPQPTKHVPLWPYPGMKQPLAGGQAGVNARV